MKVIDIMQRIANEEIFKFRIDDVNYYVDKSNYICEEDGTRVEWYIDNEWLNMNAEIIEEDKKIEKINEIEYYHQYDECWVKDKTYNDQKGNLVDEIIIDKINEIIDKLNSMEK